jgi:hypothetical protein
VFRGGRHKSNSPTVLDESKGFLLVLGDGVLLPGTLNFNPYEPSSMNPYYVRESYSLI